LARGAPIHGANGLAFDDQHRLYVASVFGREIVVIDTASGEIIERLGPERGVEGPDDLAFGPDGSLYWTSVLTGEVGRLAPDGSVKTQYVTPSVNPITFSDDGRLFVAQAFAGDRLYELDPELENPPRLVLGTGNPANDLNAMDFGPDGLLYAPHPTQRQIVRINVDDGTVELLAEGLPGFSCKFDASGHPHVLSVDRVVRVDPDTREQTVAAEVPNHSDNMVFDDEGRIFVSNFRDGSVRVVSPDGEVRILSPGGMIAPGGLAVHSASRGRVSIFVADFWTVREFDAGDGSAGIVDADFFFDAPQAVADHGANLILVSGWGSSVVVWDPTTQTKIDTYSGFAAPINAIPFQGSFIVAEQGSGSVVRQATDTEERTVLADSLSIPTGLAATDDDLWVAEWSSGTVWQIFADGALLEPPAVVASGLDSPEGLAVDLDGNLLVVESGAGRLSHIDPNTGDVTLVADGLRLGAPGPPDNPTYMFNGVAVSASGQIFVTGDIDNVIYRIDPDR